MNPTRATVLPSTRSARRSFRLRSLALLLALSACGGDDASESAAREASPDLAAELDAGPADDAGAPGNSSDRLELKISEGPFAGTHQVTGDMNCVAFAEQPGTWLAGLDRMGDPAISEVTLSLQGVPVTGGSSQEVLFSVVFGEPTDETSTSAGIVYLSPAAVGGTGTGRARRDGRGAVIEVDGTTESGAKVSAVIRCENVEVIQ